MQMKRTELEITPSRLLCEWHLRNLKEMRASLWLSLPNNTKGGRRAFDYPRSIFSQKQLRGYSMKRQQFVTFCHREIGTSADYLRANTRQRHPNDTPKTHNDTPTTASDTFFPLPINRSSWWFAGINQNRCSILHCEVARRWYSIEDFSAGKFITVVFHWIILHGGTYRSDNPFNTSQRRH